MLDWSRRSSIPNPPTPPITVRYQQTPRCAPIWGRLLADALVSKSRFGIGGENGKCFEKRFPGALVEALQQPPFVFLDLLLHSSSKFSSRWREPDDVQAPVERIGTTFDKSSFLKRIEDANQPSFVRFHAVSESHLGSSRFLAECIEHHVAPHVETMLFEYRSFLGQEDPTERHDHCSKITA